MTGENYFWATFAVFATVVLVIFIKRFGTIPRALYGPDFNLLTYGFLWETAITAVRGHPFWPGYQQVLFFNKESILLMTAVANTILMGLNFKLADHIDRIDGGEREGPRQRWQCLSVALGTLSLLFFVYCKANWS